MVGVGGVGVTVGVRLTVGAELPLEPEPVLELERMVTGLEWLVTGLETCVGCARGRLGRSVRAHGMRRAGPDVRRLRLGLRDGAA